ITCDSSYPYRSFDGSCNNLANPSYGQTGSAFRRILAPAYGGDGTGSTPRLSASSGGDLPNPRAISVLIHDPADFTHDSFTQMVMQWGQFLDHDITDTPTASNATVCCYDSLVTSNEVHSDVTTGGACFPIIIAEGDRYFDTVSTRCMVFYRSDPITDSDGVRQQYNAATPWIDGSQIYGTSETVAASLRSGSQGKLLVRTIGDEDFLPEDSSSSDSVCFVRESGEYCFLAGDHRVNVFAGLSAFHTIFVRYHNTICDRLLALNPSWDDETTFQEARRIVVAVLQVITYKEFMRHILGTTVANTYDLLVGDENYAYDASVDPTLSNVFSAAAYRFGHSMLSDSLTVNGTATLTSDLYMRPKYTLNSMAAVLDGLQDEKLFRTDRWYTQSLTDRMFETPESPQSGFDVAARNIQRGRDHGLPSYNAWREHYGLGKKTSFDEMDQGSARYSRLYESVDDIDLYSGGVSENLVSGGRVGELYAIIMGEQFKDLKFGDRFWFENTGDVSSFSSKQINQLRRVSLARVLCDTVTGIESVRESPFKALDDASNPLTPCSEILDINIERAWS
ncbi:hypothetical protein EGW08_006459, partial [Elysia chlorotica]